MDFLGLLLYAVIALAAVVQAVLVAVNVYEHRRRAIARQKSLPRYAPSGRALIVAPCKGYDPGLEENLEALLNQDYNDYEVAFVVEADDDPASPAIQRAMLENRRVTARLLVAGRAAGCGQKVHNLRAATADLPPEIRHLAFFDSDGRPQAHWLRALIYKHYLPQVGATTGYRWFVPQRPTAANHLACAINANVMAVLGRNSHQFVWGGSWAIRRETFEQLRIRDGWEGTLSDDLLASRMLRQAGLEVRFDPACVLASRVDFNWRGMFAFVRRQYCILRHYAFRWWLLALAAATVANAAWLASLGWLASAVWMQSSAAWLPAAVVGLLYGLGVYRGAAIQGLASIYSPASWHELRGPRRWHVWTGPVVGLIQWLAILASGFGNVVRWRAIDYRLSGGQVIAMRVLAGENRPDEAVTRTGAGAPTRTGCSQPTFQDVAEPVPVFVGPPQPPAVSPSS